MTEQEAKTKFCPYMRDLFFNSNVGAASFNVIKRYAGNDEAVSKCIASECMMWRWNEAMKTSNQPKGHCGLAGKP